MARERGWDEGGQKIAPFYIDLEQPVPANGIPKPGSLEVHLKDDHLQYAITWFALAGAVVIAFGVWVRGQRRGGPIFFFGWVGAPVFGRPPRSRTPTQGSPP